MQDGRGHSDAIAMLLGRLQVSSELKEQLFVDKLGKCTPEDSADSARACFSAPPAVDNSKWRGKVCRAAQSTALGFRTHHNS